MGTGVVLRRTGAADSGLSQLISELDEFLHSIDGDELHDRVAPFNNLEPGVQVVIAELDGEPVGCGALRILQDGTGEIKRMFVRPRARGQKIGLAILEELESWAKE